MPDKSVFDTLFGEKAYRRGRRAVQRARIFSALFSGFFGLLVLSCAAERFKFTDGNLIFRAMGIPSREGDLNGCVILLAGGLTLFVFMTILLWIAPAEGADSSERR
jgi:hypothetical protein